MEVIRILVAIMSYELRKVDKISVYKTSKDSGIRQETIKQLEKSAAGQGKLLGSAETISRYISYYCDYYPSKAYKIFYNLSIKIAGLKS